MSSRSCDVVLLSRQSPFRRLLLCRTLTHYRSVAYSFSKYVPPHRVHAYYVYSQKARLIRFPVRISTLMLASPCGHSRSKATTRARRQTTKFFPSRLMTYALRSISSIANFSCHPTTNGIVRWERYPKFIGSVLHRSRDR